MCWERSVHPSLHGEQSLHGQCGHCAEGEWSVEWSVHSRSRHNTAVAVAAWQEWSAEWSVQWSLQQEQSLQQSLCGRGSVQ